MNLFPPFVEFDSFPLLYSLSESFSWVVCLSVKRSSFQDGVFTAAGSEMPGCGLNTQARGHMIPGKIFASYSVYLTMQPHVKHMQMLTPYETRHDSHLCEETLSTDILAVTKQKCRGFTSVIVYCFKEMLYSLWCNILGTTLICVFDDSQMRKLILFSCFYVNCVTQIRARHWSWIRNGQKPLTYNKLWTSIFQVLKLSKHILLMKIVFMILITWNL